MVKLPIPFKLNFKKQSFSNSFLTLDIGSNSVKCMAFKDEGQESIAETVSIAPGTHESYRRVKLVGSAKEILEPNIVRAGNIINLDKAIEYVDSAMLKATEGLEKPIKDVIFGVGGELCTCIVTTVRVNRAQTNPIEQKELDNINQKTIDSAFARAQEKIARTSGDLEPEIELITSSTVYTKIDGNFTKDLLGKPATKIEIAVFTAFVPTFHLNMLQEMAEALRLDILAVTSNLYALAEALKISKNNNLLDGIVIDIGGDTTEVGVVFGGGIVNSKVLNIGGNHFTKHLSAELGLTYLDAQKKKYDFTFGNLHGEEAENIENGLQEITDLWIKGLEVLFNDFTGIKTFASEVYLTGGGSKLPTIQDALENTPWTRSIPFRKPPEFNKIELKDLIHVQDSVGVGEQNEFVTPAALSIIYFELKPTNV